MNTALRFSRIDPDQQADLLKEIRHILREVGAHNVAIYDQTYWNWQYRDLPTGISHVYAAWDHDRIIGYYHVPVYRFSVDGRSRLIGNIQDVAVNPDYRGMGLFRKLAEFANADLDRSEVDLIYTFPNERSIHTFLKYNGFNKICAVPAFVRPVNTRHLLAKRMKLLGLEQPIGRLADRMVQIAVRRPKIGNAEVEIIRTMTEEVEQVFRSYAASFPLHLVRDREWLDWRYHRSVRGRHLTIGLREAGRLTAVAVLKEDEMLGNPALLLMDHAHLDGKENSLLHLLDRTASEPELTGSRFDLLFVAGSAPVLSSLRQIGFLPVPERFNPRVLNLLARSTGSISADRLHRPDQWLLTLGDWDVF